MEVLTTLTSSLVDDDFRDQLVAAKSSKEVMQLFGAEEVVSTEAAPEPEAEEEQPEMVKDISRHAYPLVLGAGVLISAFLFLLL